MKDTGKAALKACQLVVHTCAHTPRTPGATYPWPAFLCLLISFSPSMIHCMIF